MDVITSYSESGGVTKTTAAVGIATAAARSYGLRTVLLDLDPRGAATKWTQAEPLQPGLSMNAILAQDDVTGWVQDMTVPVSWGRGLLSIVPADRGMSYRESRDAGADDRLLRSLEGLEADLVVIDAPNRQGGPLIRSALIASTGVVYAATPNGDGVDGVRGARETVQRVQAGLTSQGGRVVEERGIILGRAWPSSVATPLIQLAAIDDLRATGLLLEPFVTAQTIIEQVRVTGDWFGDYRGGLKAKMQYDDLLQKVIR